MAGIIKIIPTKQQLEEAEQAFMNSLGCGYIPLVIRRQILNKMVAESPEPTKNRLRALRGIQYECTKLEAEFYKEMYILECKYQDKYNKLHEKRTEIISGAREPTAEESSYPLGVTPVDQSILQSKIYDIAKSKVTVALPPKESIPGIPYFWLQVFRNVSLLSDLIQKRDMLAFSALKDLRVNYVKECMGFILEFHFGKNEFFSNNVLTKEYVMKCVPDEEDPFTFDGPEIIKCKGCKIDWYPGKDLTALDYVESPNEEGEGEKDDTPSFFEFFAPPLLEEGSAEEEEDILLQLSCDYEVANYLRENVIPRAVLFYTGEEADSDDSDDSDKDDLEDEVIDEEGEINGDA